MPTRQISPVRLQQTVGVPEKEMSFSNSCASKIQPLEVPAEKDAMCGEQPTYDERPLEAPLDKDLVFLSQRHLKCYQAWPENGQRSHDAQDVGLFKSVAKETEQKI